ncbi:MAG: (d)CMP kinase [Deltaproteobacteria bacterium]
MKQRVRREDLPMKEKQQRFAIAIDGPAGAGKSTIAKILAKELGIVYIDTGAMYRAVALAVLRKGMGTKDSEEVFETLKEINISMQLGENGQEIILNRENVNSLIRTPEVSAGSSNVAAFPEVRKRMVEIQRRIAEENDVVMDGRDIGTNVLPNADLKIFLTASVESRAKRRYDELKQKGYENISLKKIEDEIIERDYNDSNREYNPLKAADDAVVLDTTNLSIDEVVKEILNMLKR